MAEQLGDWTRTHTCGALRATDIGREVTLLGWVHRVRDLGALVFLDVRDRYGLTQVVVQDGQPFLQARQAPRAPEFVVGVRGTVRARAADAVNPKMPTGEVEVAAAEFRVLNEAAAAVPDRRRGDRRPRTCGCATGTSTCGARGCRRTSACATASRWPSAGTSTRRGSGRSKRRSSAKSTPEGARDYLVPSRVHPGRVLRAAAVAAALQADPDDRRAPTATSRS